VKLQKNRSALRHGRRKREKALHSQLLRGRKKKKRKRGKAS